MAMWRAGDVGGRLLDRPDALLDTGGPGWVVMSNCTNDGDAWTQRRASMTLEKMPRTPLEPGGRRRRNLLHDRVGVDTAAPRLVDLGSAEGVAEPAHRRCPH